MQQQDRSDKATSTTGEAEDSISGASVPSSPVTAVAPAQKTMGFEWFAVAVSAIISAIFALATHLNSLPASSLVPAAVLSATGCGLLITGLRKLRTAKGAGLIEAALSGLILALAQFIAAISFPNVIQSLSADPLSQPGFFTTWGLVAAFTILFSVVGATLGHLVFAPLRPLPVKAKITPAQRTDARAIDEEEEIDEPVEDDAERSAGEKEEMEDEEPSLTTTTEVAPVRSRLNYIISILLLGLAPFVVGYVFAAAFDFALNLNRYEPGPFPTLRLLGALLPWQIPLSINQPALNLTLVWRIPFPFGNPTLFDMQAIEPFVFNAIGLACAFLGTFALEQHAVQIPSRLPWRALLVFEALLGVALVLPANLWTAFGLHGLLQSPLISIPLPLRTLALLNPLTFAFNLLSAPLVCLIIGIVVVRLRRL